MRKNVSGQHVCFQMVSSTDGSAVTSGTPTVYVTLDAGTQSTGSGTSAHEGNGCWSYAPTQAETNGNHAAFTMVLTGAISQTVNVYPVGYDETSTNLPANVTQIAGAAVNASLAQLGVNVVNAGGTAWGSGAITAAALAADAVSEIVVGIRDLYGVTGTCNVGPHSGSTFEGDTGLSATDNFYTGSVVVFTSGTLDGIARRITGYTGSSREITVSPALPAVPVDGNTFMILGRID